MIEEVIIWNIIQLGNCFFFDFYSILKINKPQKGIDMITLGRMDHFRMGV